MSESQMSSLESLFSGPSLDLFNQVKDALTAIIKAGIEQFSKQSFTLSGAVKFLSVLADQVLALIKPYVDGSSLTKDDVLKFVDEVIKFGVQQLFALIPVRFPKFISSRIEQALEDAVDKLIIPLVDSIISKWFEKQPGEDKTDDFVVGSDGTFLQISDVI